LIAVSESTAGNSSLDAPSKARTAIISPGTLAKTHPPRPPMNRRIPVPLAKRVVVYHVRSADLTAMTEPLPD
jgi:hypothetical protein